MFSSPSSASSCSSNSPKSFSSWWTCKAMRVREKPQQISCKTFYSHNIPSNVTWTSYKIHNCISSESERQIDYLEKNYLQPLRDAEKKAGKVVLNKKDRRTLQKIHGIIETNALYLTGNNEVAGKLNLKNEKGSWVKAEKGFSLFHYQKLKFDVTFHCRSFGCR